MMSLMKKFFVLWLEACVVLLTAWCWVLLEKLTGLQIVKKFPTFHGTPKVHYRTYKRPPPVSILGQPNPVHIPTSHLLEIHPNIIHPSTPRSPQWSLSLRFPTKTLYTPLSSHITKCSNELNNKLISTRQHNKYLLEYIGYMFRPVNRSSSGLHRNKSLVLFRYWYPNIFTIVNVHKNWYWIKCETYNAWLKRMKTRVGIWHYGPVLSPLACSLDYG